LLGPFVSLGALPPQLDPDGIHLYAGALNGTGRQGPFWSNDGSKWNRLGPMGDRVPGLAEIRRDGVGLAVFLPQKLGFTRDGGRTWTALAADKTMANTLAWFGEDRIAVLSQTHDSHTGHFAGTETLCWKVGEDRLRPCTLPQEEEGASQETEVRNTVGARDDYRLPAVVSGDTVIAYLAGSPPQLLRRKIGEGWTEARPTLACDDSSGPVQLAACGDTVVVGCGPALEIERGGVRRTLRPSKELDSFALASPTQLWAVGDDNRLLVLDLNRPAFKRVGTLADTWAVGKRLVATCSPRVAQSPLFVLNPEVKRVAGSIVPSPSPTVRAFTSELPRMGDRAIPAVDSQGRLVYLSDEERASLVRVRLDGTFTSVALPEPVATASGFQEFPGPQLLSSLREGRALMVDEHANAWQTVDDGAHWQRVPGPFPAYGERPHVLCGSNRCEVDAAVYRVGWPSASSAPLPMDPGLARIGCHMCEQQTRNLGACKPIAPLGACTEIPVFARGLGSALFSGICGERVDENRRRYLSFHGFADRREVRRPFEGVFDASEDPHLWIAASSFIAFRPESPRRDLANATSRRWLIDDGPARPTVAAEDLPVLKPSLFDVEDGYLQVELQVRNQASLAWHHRGGSVEGRLLGPVAEALLQAERDVIGTIIVDQQDSWIGAVLSFSAVTYGGGLLIFKIPRRGVPSFRWLVARSPQQLEWGLGLVMRHGVPYLAGLEWTAADTTVARLRPIGASLDLGDAIDLEGGTAQAGHLIDPKPCPATQGPAARMLTSSLLRHEIELRDDTVVRPESRYVDDESDLMGYVAHGRIVGPVVRDLRIHGNAICAERTSIGGNSLGWHEQRRLAVMVGAGDGRGTAAVDTHWVTCALAF
jgi:hypothetical protein